MRLQIPLLLLAFGGAGAQAPFDVTTRVDAGAARGFGGRYTSRELASFSMAMNVGRFDAAGNGPFVGGGFTAYLSSGSPRAFVCIADATVPGGCQVDKPFPDVMLGHANVGYRRLAGGFSLEAELQPGVAFVNRPDIVPVALGGGVTVGHRLRGPFGVELGASGAYLPAFDANRIGLRRVTLGIRSW